MKTETKKRERKTSKLNKKRNSIIVGSVVLGFAFSPQFLTIRIKRLSMKNSFRPS